MLDATQLAQIRAAILENEGADAAPYELTYAQKGRSGASFGRFQGDLSKQEDARQTLQAALTANGMAAAAAQAIVARLSVQCTQSPLTPAEDAAVAAALASAAGQALVDQMDARISAGVTDQVDRCLVAATGAGRTVANAVLAAIGCWTNMTGTPDTLRAWLAGTPAHLDGGIVPPPGAAVGLDDVFGYLLKSKYFIENPRNMAHFKESVAKGMQANA